MNEYRMEKIADAMTRWAKRLGKTGKSVNPGLTAAAKKAKEKAIRFSGIADDAITSGKISKGRSIEMSNRIGGNAVTAGMLPGLTHNLQNTRGAGGFSDDALRMFRERSKKGKDFYGSRKPGEFLRRQSEKRNGPIIDIDSFGI